MRRPPANLDDFLSGGEGAITTDRPEEGDTEERRTSETPKAVQKKAAGEPARDSAATGVARPGEKKKRRKRATPSTAETTTALGSDRASNPRSTNRPKIPRKAPAAMIESTASPNESGERRGRTVPGEAAPTVIMSVRVPIDLRERLEDILAAYSGVTFSDLVIRGLQTMVNEVEQRHRERTGEELPKRQSRPEFPL